jgi:hypothetical protein
MHKSILAVALLFLAARVQAQTYTSAAECGTTGPVLYSTTLNSALEINTAQLAIMDLVPQYTGAGYRWDLTYTLTRTRSDYPYWSAYPRVDIQSADGQAHGRTRSYSVSGTTTDTITFYGDDHPSARPTRLRFTFAQSNTFPYHVSATLTVRAVNMSNCGGTVREKPSYMAIGSAAAPNWICGDMTLTTEANHFFLFYVRPGQQLRAKVLPSALMRNGSALTCNVYDLNMRSLGQAATMLSLSTTDLALFTNNQPAARFIVVGLYSSSGLAFQNMGFYSPQGASPAPGEVVPPPTPDQINPYVPVAAGSQDASLPANGSTTFVVPGTGELSRLRVRVLRNPYLTGGAASVTLILRSQTGSVIYQRYCTVGFFEPYEWFLDLDLPTGTTDPARLPGSVDVVVGGGATIASLHAERALRTR